MEKQKNKPISTNTLLWVGARTITISARADAQLCADLRSIVKGGK